MSNVEYRCPAVKEIPNPDNPDETIEVRICSNKLFALPGGNKLRCRVHDLQYVQTEVTDAPDYLFVDEDKKGRTRDLILPDGTRASVEGAHSPDEATSTAPTAEVVMMRQMYERVVGDKPDLRWGAARIKDEIDEYVEALKVQDKSSGIEIAGEPNNADATENVTEDVAAPWETDEIEDAENYAPIGQIVDSIPN